MNLISRNVAYRVKKQPKQLPAVLDQTPDLICLQKDTEKAARLWKDGLRKSGYSNIITTFDTTETPDDLNGPRKFGLLIASKWHFEGLDHEDLEIPCSEKLLSFLVHHPSQEFPLYTAHNPPGFSNGWIYGEQPLEFKLDTWYRYLENSGI